jgi:hypothetical protein
MRCCIWCLLTTAHRGKQTGGAISLLCWVAVSTFLRPVLSMVNLPGGSQLRVQLLAEMRRTPGPSASGGPPVAANPASPAARG